jgi:hypothetical protein
VKCDDSSVTKCLSDTCWLGKSVFSRRAASPAKLCVSLVMNVVMSWKALNKGKICHLYWTNGAGLLIAQQTGVRDWPSLSMGGNGVTVHRANKLWRRLGPRASRQQKDRGIWCWTRHQSEAQRRMFSMLDGRWTMTQPQKERHKCQGSYPFLLAFRTK